MYGLDILNGMRLGQFHLNYQPIFFEDKNKLFGAEVLLRWMNRERIISPCEFICYAEECDLIDLLTLHLFNLLEEDLCAVNIETKINISINLSPLSMINDLLVNRLIQLNKIMGQKFQFIIELTEDCAICNYEESFKNIELLKEKGIKVALDDFGKGFSTLERLMQFPFDYIKLDRLFLNSYNFEAFEKVLEISVITKSKIIAEGIELKEQYDFLRKKNIELYQGFYFCKPVSTLEFISML
ncbi:TPA: EAL domain-containing protein [Klebsiella pneumoniae]|uniref:EAL domain-containing protein n=1 Tax=Klebsiella quasipneumoniae TaxID=1463165 RepID=UPI0024801E10|nr:EAL domain-containing protein [Klebsiella quasipneumoniae]MDH8260061.1 EAL domain-containing protein [Klebsiella quasipneumoniae]